MARRHALVDKDAIDGDGGIHAGSRTSREAALRGATAHAIATWSRGPTHGRGPLPGRSPGTRVEHTGVSRVRPGPNRDMGARWMSTRALAMRRRWMCWAAS